MKVVALISGGKDSIYAMMKCQQHGHEIVALANLYPPARFDEEMDCTQPRTHASLARPAGILSAHGCPGASRAAAFMYQTVGHAHIGATAEAMGLPLFRREIAGGSIEQGLHYKKTEGDEVEDLLHLLSTVVAQMPEVGAVCAGAILSNYQRARVESVCARLGLASLAYLWQREQAPLLEEMVGAGVSAVLVKVASLGLNASHLGRTISELRPTFHKLNARFGFHVCGEGGEYETFTLDCPLFRRRIEPVASRVVEHGGGVALLSFEAVELRDKPPADANAPMDVDADSPSAQEEEEEAEAADDDDEALAAMLAASDPLGAREATWTLTLDAAGGGDPPAAPTAIAPIVTPLGGGLWMIGAHGSGSGEGTAQLEATLGAMRDALERVGLGLGEVLLVRLYVADMSAYAELNRAYSSFFDGFAPAARVAVQLPLDALAGGGGGSGGSGGGRAVSVEWLAWQGSKQLLHVQSLSEWAPRMIGPYCQLTCGLGLASVAGSIGLRPASMTLVEGGAAAQAAVALRNCVAVLGGLSIAPTGALSLVLYVTRAADGDIVRAVATRWLRRVTDRREAPAGVLPPLLVLQVGALPMGALVEAQLEATTDGAPPRLRWSLEAQLDAGRSPSKPIEAQLEAQLDAAGAPAELLVDVAVGTAVAPPPAGNRRDGDDRGEAVLSAATASEAGAPLVASGSANCVVAAAEGATISAEAIGKAMVGCIERLESRLSACSPPCTLGPTLYLRALYGHGLGVDAAHLDAAIGAAIRHGIAPRTCTVHGLPVARVLAAEGRARVVLQLHFTAAQDWSEVSLD